MARRGSTIPRDLTQTLPTWPAGAQQPDGNHLLALVICPCCGTGFTVAASEQRGPRRCLCAGEARFEPATTGLLQTWVPDQAGTWRPAPGSGLLREPCPFHSGARYIRSAHTRATPGVGQGRVVR